MLTQLDPTSHWLAGQIAGIHLFTLAGGMMIGAAAVLLYHSIGRIAGVSGIFFAGVKEGALWRCGAGCSSAASCWAPGWERICFPR